MHRLIRIAARIIAIIVATIGVPGGPGALAPSGFSQAFTVNPVRIVSTRTAGSSADGLIRLAAQRLSEQFGQPVVVDVQDGAGGILGAQAVARSAADGHTMLYTLSTTVVITPQLLKTRPYELKDLTPLMVTSRAAISMVANIAFPPSNKIGRAHV